jgi:thiol:disulfide interchange protein DsbD
MKSGLPLTFAALAILLLTIGAPAQEYRGRHLVVPQLVAETSAVKAGQPFTVGVLLKIEPGWHTYWQFSGDSGAPMVIDWQLPPGFKAGAIQWPLPHARMDPGDLLTYVYEGEVMVLIEITPPADVPPGEVQLSADLRWLVCEKTCVPGEGKVSLKLPGGETPAPQHAELFAKYRALLPKSSGAPFSAEWERSAEAVKVRVSGLPKEFAAEFFPLPPSSDVKPDHPQVSEIAPDGSRTFTVPITEGGAPDLAWQGVLATQKGDAPREGWLISAGAAGETPTADTIAPPLPAGSASGAKQNIWLVLWGAFLGGMILNLMPCVLPVIRAEDFRLRAASWRSPTARVPAGPGIHRRRLSSSSLPWRRSSWR